MENIEFETKFGALTAEEIRKAAVIYTSAVISELEKRKKKHSDERRDYRLHNTKMLLKNYRKFVGFLDTAAKAVHYPTVGAKIEVAEQTKEFVVCLAHMEAHGKVQFFSPAHLGFEYFPLLLEKGFVPIEVETYLPYPDVDGLRVEQFLAYQF